MIAALLSLALLAPAPAGAGGAPPVVSLSATPSRVLVDARGTTRVEVANRGRSALRVTVAPDGLVLDLRGRPTLRRATTARWLHVAPRELSLLPGSSSSLTVRSSAPSTAEPGDHHAVLLLTTRPLARGGVSVRMRVGVRVVIRVPGAMLRRLRIERLRVRGRRLEVTLANAGNMTEELARGRLRVELRRAGRLLARLHAPRRELLPHSRAVLSVGAPRNVRGAVTAVVLIRDGPQRSFRARLRR